MAGDKKIPFEVVGSFKGSELEGVCYEQLLPYAQPKDGDAFLGFGKLNFNHNPSLNLSKKGDLNEAAFNLFNFLRKLDKLNKNNISVYPIPKKGIGKAINERLARAECK